MQCIHIATEYIYIYICADIHVAVRLLTLADSVLLFRSVVLVSQLLLLLLFLCLLLSAVFVAAVGFMVSVDIGVLIVAVALIDTACLCSAAHAFEDWDISSKLTARTLQHHCYQYLEKQRAGSANANPLSPLLMRHVSISCLHDFCLSEKVISALKPI